MGTFYPFELIYPVRLAIFYPLSFFSSSKILFHFDDKISADIFKG